MIVESDGLSRREQMANDDLQSRTVIQQSKGKIECDRMRAVTRGAMTVERAMIEVALRFVRNSKESNCCLLSCSSSCSPEMSSSAASRCRQNRVTANRIPHGMASEESMDHHREQKQG